MRVAHIIKVTRISGAERHLLVLLKGLRQSNIDAFLIILVEPDQPMDDMLAEAQVNHIPIYRIMIRRDYDLTMVLRLRKILRDLQPDILHTHLIHADLYGLMAGKLARIPTIIASRHNDDRFRYRPLIQRLSQVMWRLSDGGIAISDAIKHFTLNIEGASESKIDTIHYGIKYRWITDSEIRSAQNSLRKELNLTNETMILGMVCRLVEQKGIRYALVAFRGIYDEFPQAHLIIAGDGELAEELHSQTQLLGISDRVHWLGWREDAQAIFASMDIFLLPSLWEGFGLVLLEAMSMRVPIIASRVSAIPEIVENGITGLLVEPRNTDELSKAMLCLLEDRPLRKHMGLLGADRLEQKFSVTQMIDKTIEIYRKRLST